MLVMPSHDGYMVDWETGETYIFRGIEKRRHKSYTTTSKEQAEKKAEELKQAGYNNVKIYECIF